jgi:hypothetical protein
MQYCCTAVCACPWPATGTPDVCHFFEQHKVTQEQNNYF